MNIKIKNKNGITLKTEGKYCKEDINVLVDESILGGGGEAGGSGKQVYCPIATQICLINANCFTEDSDITFNNPDNIPIYKVESLIDPDTYSFTYSVSEADDIYTTGVSKNGSDGRITLAIQGTDFANYKMWDYCVRPEDLIGKTIPYFSGMVLETSGSSGYGTIIYNKISNETFPENNGTKLPVNSYVGTISNGEVINDAHIDMVGCYII